MADALTGGFDSTASRPLNHEEFLLARGVFRHTIPARNVRITPTLGFQKRAYTLLGMKKISAPADDNFAAPVVFYYLNVGDAFAGMQLDVAWKRLLIHELTHVWQSCHSA